MTTLQKKLISITALLCVTAGVQAATLIASQDNYVLNSASSTVQDATGHLVVKRASNNIRKSWIKFDFSGENVDFSQSGTVTLTLAANSSADETFKVALYALKDDQDPGTGWTENAITWSNAPGNDTGGAGINDLESRETTFLGETATIASSTAAGTTFEFTIDTLSDFRQVNNTLTVIAISSYQSDFGPSLAFASSENATEAWRPTLEYSVIPEPSSVALVLLGFAGFVVAIRRKP
ncbi:DNRLRE domain-containing protein [Kiritimatiellota bacterium B12222]|nr:DNRLRE domain-containing protein [Kiritimatiellota bacterium B12222]